MCRMKFPRNLVLALLFSLLPLGLSHADEGKYEFVISSSIQAGLTHGPNAIGFVRKNVPFVIKTSTPITARNISSVTVPAIIAGRYPSPKGPVYLELNARIDKQQVETNYTPSQVDAIVYEWEESYSTPAPLKAFQPQV